MGANLRNISLWVFILLAFIVVAQKVTKTETAQKMTLFELMQLGNERVDGKLEKTESHSKVLSVVDRDTVLQGKYIGPDGKEKAYEVRSNPNLARDIFQWAMQNKIKYDSNVGSNFLSQLFFSALVPIVFFVVLWLLLMRQFQSGSNKAMSFGKSRAKLVTEGQIKVTFKDVAGIDEVREELTEIIQFLKDPQKFSRLGAKIPKGALLYGPPGTGKTLIARAVSGEASVPFFSISGSDFVEMFVGVGASRVRDLFEQGKKAKPCLIFIDEIDAVGRHRFAGIGGGHDEREQTLNQLLVELDGFAPNEGVIVMASTNRPDVLDPALLRPGRFDRQIRVDLPDLLGREKILEVHTRGIKMGENVVLRDIAKGTPGFSGADLANLANEAALLAARADKAFVEMSDLEEAKDRVMMGPERRSLVLSDKEKRNTAFHEAGHALVAKFTADPDHKVHKVTIIPRGRSLGLTAILPEQDQHSVSRRQLLNTLRYVMGGRAAEIIWFGETEATTGASNDLQRATELAHRMVCEFGMSERLGPRTFGEPSGQVFLGKDMGRERGFSEETASIIDSEIHDILNNAYSEAQEVLTNHKEILERVAEVLLERESLDGPELDAVVRGETLPPLFRDEKSRLAKAAAEETSPGKPMPNPLLEPPTA